MINAYVYSEKQFMGFSIIWTKKRQLELWIEDFFFLFFNVLFCFLFSFCFIDSNGANRNKKTLQPMFSYLSELGNQSLYWIDPNTYNCLVSFIRVFFFLSIFIFFPLRKKMWNIILILMVMTISNVPIWLLRNRGQRL